MSSLVADLGIWALLFAGIVFCGIGLMGLSILPDTVSRMFTAFRATALGTGAVILAVAVYGSYLFMTTGDWQYPALILHTLLLGLVLAAGIWLVYGVIRKRVRNRTLENAGRPPAVSGNEVKDEE